MVLKIKIWLCCCIIWWNIVQVVLTQQLVYSLILIKYKAKLLENAVADGNNSILKNATIAVPLKYLSNFWQSLEMPLINWKVKLKIRWTKHCFSASATAEYDDADSNNIIFTIKDTKLFILLNQWLIQLFNRYRLPRVMLQVSWNFAESNYESKRL